MSLQRQAGNFGMSTMRTITTKTRTRAAGCRFGFTLVEMAIVVMIISVLAAVAIPSFFDSLMFHQVESAARRVKSDLELARHTARLASASQSVAFSGATYTLSTAQNLDNVHKEYSVDLSAAPFNVELVSVNFDGETSVSFDGYGTPTSGGTIELRSKTLKCTVTLDGVTGNVSIASGHADGRTAKVAAPLDAN
jgi:prepilin-type N-terminal cleavage/methylation domain-containing protein